MLLDLLEEGIQVIDSRGRTVIYNQKMADLEKMGPGEVLGEELLDVFPSLNEESSNLIRTLRTGERTTNNQQDYCNKFGQRITTINSTYPLSFEDGSRWALEISRDITLIRELYGQIISLQDRLYRPPSRTPGKKRSHYLLSDIVGRDKRLRRLISQAQKAAATDSPVLILGETGTGKELFAQGIHYASPRGPFVAQNCAALPEHLLEGILFGTRKGGFTGAVNRKGLFAQANGGTLLLDEINALSLGLQAKLLRALEEGRIRPLGGDAELQVDVRVISTMNRSPQEAMREGNLREDLYYRLAVVFLPLPTLAERPGDILLLADSFIHHYNARYHLTIKGLSPAVQEIFLQYPWPGNVRQLKHVIEGAINCMEEEDLIQEKHLGPILEIQEGGGGKLSLPHRLQEMEKVWIQEALEKSSGSISLAAKRLGLKRQSLQYRLRKYGMGKKPG